MAELALGGFELTVRTRSIGCPHTQLLSVASTGVERSICEDCGAVSITFTDEIAGPAHRLHFARRADRDADSGPAYPFATHETIGLTRRSSLRAIPDFLLSA